MANMQPTQVEVIPHKGAHRVVAKLGSKRVTLKAFEASADADDFADRARKYSTGERYDNEVFHALCDVQGIDADPEA